MLNEEQEQRRAERRKRILSWIIVILMVLSVGGYYVGSDSDGATRRYNGVKFTATPQGHLATIDGVRYGFNFDPVQVEGIPTDPGVADLLRGPSLTVSYDPASNYSEGMAAVQYYLSEVLGARNTYVLPATLSNSSYDLPVATCANATRAEPVLTFAEGNQTRIAFGSESCIAVSVARDEDVYRVQDKLVLLVLGVMDR